MTVCDRVADMDTRLLVGGGWGGDVGGEDDYKNACPISSKSNAENKNDNKKKTK